MEQIKHKVAILTTNVNYGSDWDEADRWLARHITDWSEVTHEEFKMLHQGVIMVNNKYNSQVRLLLVEYPQNPTQILFDTIEEGKAYFSRIDAERIRHQKEQEEKKEKDRIKKAEKKLIKEAKTLEEKKKMLSFSLAVVYTVYSTW